MAKSKDVNLIVEHPHQHVTWITLNRPDVANAFNTQMAIQLTELFQSIPLDAKDTRCIVVTGAGDRAFCSGADLKERKGLSTRDWCRQHIVFERLARAIINCPMPIIGAINGAAYAGGCEMALAFDFLFASENARFALTETTLGIIPGMGGTQNLPRAIGERRAKEIILSGSAITALEAESWGLVNRVIESEKLCETTLEIAVRIAQNAPIAVRQAKQSIHRGLQMSLSDGLCFEVEAYNRTIPTRDREEGILAFNEKRLPLFRGE